MQHVWGTTGENKGQTAEERRMEWPIMCCTPKKFKDCSLFQWPTQEKFHSLTHIHRGLCISSSSFAREETLNKRLPPACSYQHFKPQIVEFSTFFMCQKCGHVSLPSLHATHINAILTSFLSLSTKESNLNLWQEIHERLEMGKLNYIKKFTTLFPKDV